MLRKLKILFVLQTPWGTSLGMSKVHYELKKAYENMGHQVDYLDASKIYPKGDKVLNHIIGAKITQQRIFDYLKIHASKYDVIDANQRCIPYPKESFGFNGKLIFRSHGLPPLYRIMEQHPLYKKMEREVVQSNQISFKERFGNLKRFIMEPAPEWVLWDSIKYADIVHVLNQSEYDYLKTFGVPVSKLKCVPNGLDDEYINQGKENTNFLNSRTEISFVGSWTIRKGVNFLPDIAEKLSASVSCLNLLGTGGKKEIIQSKFKATATKINVHTHYDIRELSNLLKNTKVGIFTSFVEGFGLSIVEQLALGIPVVAFDIPGPSDILKPIDPMLIVPLGEVHTMIDRINRILSMSETEYHMLTLKCVGRATDFKNEKIAVQFIEIYNS